MIRIALNWMKSQDHLGFILLDNWIIIDYVANRTYILTASKTRQIQVNYLLNLRYGFKYPTTVNIIKYDDILFYTFDTQAVNHLSPYAGFRLPLLQEHMLGTFCYINNILHRQFTYIINDTSLSVIFTDNLSIMNFLNLSIMNFLNLSIFVTPGCTGLALLPKNLTS